MYDYRIFYPQIGVAEQRVRRTIVDRPTRPAAPRVTPLKAERR